MRPRGRDKGRRLEERSFLMPQLHTKPRQIYPTANMFTMSMKVRNIVTSDFSSLHFSGSEIGGEVRSVKYTGADARRAVFNSHLHRNDPVNFQVCNFSSFNCNPTTYLTLRSQPKIFENRPQGPHGNKSKPIPHMKGKGQEFPLSKNPSGYHGGPPGPARVIIQRTRTGKPSI